jgi:trimeric autotransporter adhesin
VIEIFIHSRQGAIDMKTNPIKLILVVAAVQVLAMLYPAVASAQGFIASGQTLTGTISPVGDSDTWTFSANVGDAIVIRVGEITQTGSFTPRIRLFNPSATLLATAFGALAAEINSTAAVGGTFTVIVDDANGTTATGTYRLTLAKTGSAVVVSPGDEGGPMTNGAVHTGVIDVGDLDVWTVTANVGESIVVRMAEVAVGGAMTPWVRIYSPTGALLASSFSAVTAEVVATAAASGTFLVVVGDGSAGLAGSGAYRLTVAKTGSDVVVSTGDEGGPMTNGVMHTGTIDVGDLDLWTVTANVGESIVVRMGEVAVGGTLTPWVRIYSPTGAIMASSFSAVAAEVAVTAAASGTFLVVVGDGSSGLAGSGAYRLTLAKTGSPVVVSAGDEGGPMTNGAIHAGAIDAGDLDVWTVTANVGESIVVRMGEVAVGGALTPWVRIYSPTGALMDSSFSAVAAEVAVTAAASGTFLVVVGDGSSGLAGSGAYHLTLAKTGSAVVVSAGDEGGPLPNGVSTGIIDVGDLDAWTAFATVGDHIVITMDEVNAGSSLTPWVRIYAPSGALLGTSFGVSTAQVSVTASSSGTFLVVAGDGSSGLTGSGAYTLTTSGTTGSPSPALASAVSRRVHGAAGTFDLVLSLVSTNPTTEPRQGPAQTVVFTFDKPINAATAIVAEGTATAATPIISGSDVIVGLTGVNNQQYVTIALTDVASVDGGTAGGGSVRIGFLLGDVNQNRVVTLSDLGLVNAQLAQSVTAANYLKDVNASGTLTLSDKGITNANLTKALPPP